MTQTGYSVRIGSPLYDAYPGSDSIAVPIYITNATELYGLSLGFHYNSDDIEVTSIDFTGGVIPNLNRVFAIRPTDNDVVIAWSLWCSGLSVQTDALLGTLNVQILAGETNQEIPLDSAFVSPGVDFMFVTSAGASIRPELEYPTGLPSFTFTDIAAAAGVDMPTNWADVQFVDYNGDNLLDIYQHGTLLRNNGDSTFSDVTGSSGIDASDYLSGAWADYDNDGHIDAAISKNGETNSIRLYHNDGDGTFTNVTASAQINMPGRKVNWVDYDNDGFVDLFSSYDPGGVPNGVMSLWKNNGDGTFTDVTVDAGLDSSIDVSASSFFDHNNDSYQDLVVSAFWNTSRIFENNGDGTFTDKTGEYGLGVRPSQGITSGDFNFDGWLDFFVGVYYDTYSRLYRNDAGSGFTDVTVDFNAIGPTGDVIRVVNFADFNNDSYLDIYESNYNSGDPSILFLYDSDLNEFYRAENSAGVANTSSHKASHAIGDFDNDGDLDILAEGQSGDANRLYSNNLYPGNSTRHWIGFRLTGIMSNRSAIGARVMVYCDSVLMREINTGGGWSQNQLWPHFGIGEQTAVDSVRILWPSGEVDRLLNPAIDQYHSINEGSYAHRAWHVATTGSDLTGDGSAGNPYETIQHAIDQSADGDTVLVHDGTYDGVGNREIDFSGKQIIVQSENGPEVTIIESKTNPFTYELIYFQNDEDTLTQLQGFTIRYGKRGIRIDGASPKIVDCNITVNIGLFSDGNGVYITNGSPHFLHCEFDTNGCFDPAYGAAITCNTGDPVFDSCLFIGNGASVSDATGAMAFYNSSPVLRNCTFSHNSNPGSNIFKANQSDINMVNCILAYSDSDDDAVVCYSGGTVNLSCCNIYGNTGGDYVGCLVGQEGINGNTSADPLFCNTANSDFHIKYGSPCAPVNNSCHELIGALNYGGAVVVDNLDNDGRGSLRWAIDSANTNAGCDTILFTMEGAVALTSSLPTVTDNETVILGNSAPGGDGSVVLDGSGFGKTLNSGIVLNSSDNVISGLTIAGFAGNGIEITGAGSVNNTITNILIYDNGGLGIDLNDDGVTANDAGDTDTGANELLNYPEFDSVVFTPDTTFMLYGHALANALIDLYVAHPGGDTLEPEDGSGHGEAYSYVGRDTADAGGDFVHEIGTAFSQFSKITATATDHHGNTSEFSENVTLTPAPLIIVGYSPINLQIFDPAGDSIGKTPDGIFFTSIVPASYTEITNDSVHIDYPLPGDYEIIVVPENDAPPGGVYSIGIRLDGSLQCIIIEDAEVPADGQADTLGYEVVENFHYLNGDATRDDTINLLDILHLISYIYGQPPGPAPYPEGSGDANCDQVLNLLDILYLIDNLYGTPLGPPPCDLSR
ncbi:MAG: VCBS repeat-containing protein [candidate division Zixibacteria bacterium]|nr:VCBS repeat-containing protein [candidate division Zixibacteria bacterium]